MYTFYPDIAFAVVTILVAIVVGILLLAGGLTTMVKGATESALILMGLILALVGGALAVFVPYFIIVYLVGG